MLPPGPLVACSWRKHAPAGPDFTRRRSLSDAVRAQCAELNIWVPIELDSRKVHFQSPGLIATGFAQAGPDIPIATIPYSAQPQAARIAKLFFIIT